MNYVILAAGHGSRFLNEGVNTPKPLVPLMGKPMIGRLIEILMSAGRCESIHIVANPRMEGFVAYLEGLKSKGAPLIIKPYVSTNSYSSLRIGAEGIEGKFIAMTVDAIFPTAEFREFVSATESMPDGEALMALTRFIDDESPLYARVAPGSTEITDYRYGGEPYGEGAIVSAGIYGLSAAAMEAAATAGRYPESLSDFQRFLAAESPVRVMAFEMSEALDVDCSHDCEAAERFLHDVNGEKPPRKSLREEYRDSLKSLDTEEHIDLAFYRPIGFAWACLFRRLGVSPNAVTIASIFIGVAAGACFYPSALWINIVGMLLLMWANSFDSADGQLARLTGRYSRLGRILDGVSGDFWFASIYIFICLRTVHAGGWWGAHSWAVWATAILAGVCHGKQAALADYYRQLHLRFLKGRSGSELESSARLAEADKAISWRRSPLRKLISTLYLAYTRSQEAETPAMQRLRAEVDSRWPDGDVPADFREKFLRLSRPLCKWENFMTFNWRTIFLFITLFIGRPWIYFIIELTLFNIVMLLTNLRHEYICRTLLRQLKEK